jgi:hypothetical protein
MIIALALILHCAPWPPVGYGPEPREFCIHAPYGATKGKRHAR